jgi:hypothetical protein
MKHPISVSIKPAAAQFDLFVPDAQRAMTLLLQQGVKPPRTHPCLDRDRPDPLRADPLGRLSGEPGRKE